uniref:Uncharacterized protein n=1 Tax=Arundo donax TaxID=35708 RepID=A0A0A9E2H3_ARUDO
MLAMNKVKASKNIYDVSFCCHWMQMEMKTGYGHEAHGSRGIKENTNHDHLQLVRHQMEFIETCKR